MIRSVVWMVVLLVVLALAWWVIGALGLPHIVQVLAGFVLAVVAIVSVVSVFLGKPPGW